MGVQGLSRGEPSIQAEGETFSEEHGEAAGAFFATVGGKGGNGRNLGFSDIRRDIESTRHHVGPALSNGVTLQYIAMHGGLPRNLHHVSFKRGGLP